MLTIALIFGCSEYDFLKVTDPEPAGENSTEIIETDEESIAEPSEEDTAYEEAIDEGPPAATEKMYLHTSDLLYSWNENGQLDTIGQFNIDDDYAPNITDIAIDLTGKMYAVSNTGLYRVDPTNARLEYVCDTGEYLGGLTFLADGRLLGAGESILWIEPNTCSRAIFVESGQYATSGDIVGLPDGNLYWTVQGGDDLVRVNPVTAETEWIGEIGAQNLWGVGYFNDILYGFSSAGSIVHIDPQTANILAEETTSGQYWWGAATNPVFWE